MFVTFVNENGVNSLSELKMKTSTAKYIEYNLINI